MSEYQWDFGSAASGLQFKVVYNSAGTFTVTCTTGHLDLNALWFSDGDKLVEGTVTLAKSDNSLNMNGTGITWDDVYKVSSTGLGSDGVNKISYLTAGESMSFSATTLDLPTAITALLASNPTLLTIGVRVTSDSSISGEGKYVDTSGTLITSVNHAPTLDTVSNGTVTDTAGDDTYAAVTGTLHGSDSDGNTVSYKLAGSVAASGTGDSLGFDVQKGSAYGTFYLNTTSGAYKFVANDAAVEGLKITQAVDFTVSATDDTADSATQTISISLKGVNDTPGLNASLTAKTYVDTSADDTFTSVTGQLTTADRDAGDSATYTIDGATTGSFDVNGTAYQQKLVGSFGTLYLANSGAYEYVPDDGAIEGLKTNASENFTLKVTDGSNATDTKTLTISLTGANDTPELSASLTAKTYFDTSGDDTFTSVTGQLTTADRDAGDSATYTIDGATTGSFDINGTNYQQKLVGSFGTLYLANSGAYEYVPDDGAIEGLKTNSSENFTLKVTDGSNATDTKTLTISLTGANDTPELSASLTAKTYVDTSADDTFTSVTGQLTTADRDAGDSATYTIDGATTGSFDVNGTAYQQKLVGSFGTLYLANSGAYEYVPDDGAIEGLKTNASENFTLKVTDGSNATDTKTLTISLTGANDTPELSASLTAKTYFDTSGDDTFTSVTGQLTTADRDAGDSATYTIDGATTGSFDINGTNYQQKLVGSFGTLYLANSGAYEYVPDDGAIEGLKTNSSENFTLKVTDGSGATDTKTLTISLTGANDTPELSASLTAKTYVDTSGDDTFTSVTGQLTTADRDAGDSATYTIDGATTGSFDINGTNYQQKLVGSFGTLYLANSGAYEYVPDDGAIEGLKTNASENFTLKVTDGSNATDTKTLTISLTGANDTPELSASLTAKTYADTSGDDTFTSVTGQLTTADRDAGDSATYTIDGATTGSFDVNGTAYQQKLVGSFGTLYLANSGAYEYVPNDSAIEGLKANSSENFTLKVTDGSGATDTKTLTISLTGANDTPELSASLTAKTYIDTSVDNTFTSVTGQLTTADRDAGETATYAINGATTGSFDVNGHTYQQKLVGSFGTLYLANSGAYEYVPDDGAIEGLKTNSSENFTLKVTDGSGATDTKTLTISLTGANDTPELSASLTAKTYVDTSGDDTFTSVTGQLTTADRDAGDSATYTIDGATTGSFDVNGHTYQQKLVGNFGTLYLANSGAYEYVPNDSAIEALEANTSEGFTLKVTDGSGATDTKTLTISLTGAQDAPEVTAVVAGYTDTAADNTFADTVGTLSVSSRDGDTSFTFALAGSSDSLMSGYDRQDASSNFGTLYLNSSTGAYKFVANDAAIEALEAGNNPSAIYHVTASADGIASPSQTITINLTGAEDAPVVAPVVASYTDTAADNTFADTVGTLSVTSRDGDTSFSFALAGSSSSPLPGYDRQDASSTYGTLYLNSTTGAYKFVANDAAIEALEAGNNPSAIYHVTAAADGATSTSQTITFNFTGAEDAPVVAPVVASYTDTAADDTFNDTLGTLSVSSRDGDTSFTFALAGSTTTGQLDYNLQNTSSGYGTLYLNSSTGAYKFVANDAAIEALQWGSNPNLVYNVTAAADGVTSANQTITIGITGGNDAPRDLTLTADTSNSFITGNGVPGNNGAIGTISVTTGTDVDGGGAYTYSLFSAKSGALGAASIITEASAQFAVSAAGALSTPTGLASGTIYEVTVQASQGTGSAQATYNETFSIVTGTNAGTESLPGGGYDFRSGDDVIYGRQNVDIIVAGSGNDTVFGQDGDDEIYGGTGVDLLYGGKDNDSFVFSTGDTGITLATADTIGDFNSANDTIVTSLNAGNVTIANGSGLADFNAFVAAANTVMASGSATNGAYMAWNAAGSGNGWLVIDENQNHSVDTGDTLIVLTGVNAANAFSTTDIA